MITARSEQEAYYPIEVLLPRTELTLEEAKELLDKLTAEIEIAEWDQVQKKSTIKQSSWQQDYLESFNDDGLSID